ncbi:hypothetical protein [Saccharomonospora iraqiensis]|uniref:hypothetical protein n=1 Tax=Saccharomonospora iraqiensis TaxID=52698 RepID=UPI00022E2079|nr:hypothetical protein [Saccharomonospora iraqiensis]
MTDTATATAPALPALDDLDAVLMRLRRAVDGETEPLYRHKDAGNAEVLPLLRRIGLLVLELGFTVAEEGGIDGTDVERAVAHAYGLPTPP